MGTLLLILALGCYAIASLWLVLFGCNQYYMISLCLRTRKNEARTQKEFLEKFWSEHNDADLPAVTTQLPVYNERHVVARILQAAAAIDYPRHLHQIQVLDDSTDQTTAIIAAEVQRLREQGVDIEHIRRSHRVGFKAGALAHGLETATGEYIAIFDADFVPAPDYLRQTIPFFFSDEKIALVQCRWGHLNREHSLLTKTQSLGIDSHFLIEQAARTWGGLLMNFNGTAGIWNKNAIADAGGWQHDTLTEDMDLTYRAQLKGWHGKYRSDVVVPCEIPPDINAYKCQQHRWAKGSIQTAIKLLPAILRSDTSAVRKFQAAIHLTQYLVHPMITVLAILYLPLMTALKPVFVEIPLSIWVLALTPLMIGTFGPITAIAVGQWLGYPRGQRRLRYLPALTCLGTGIAINNTKAVLEALCGHKSDFVRTPKYGDAANTSTINPKDYRLPVSMIYVIEVLLGLYCLTGALLYIQAGDMFMVPFLVIYAAGFISVGVLSLRQGFNQNLRMSPA